MLIKLSLHAQNGFFMTGQRQKLLFASVFLCALLLALAPRNASAGAGVQTNHVMPILTVVHAWSDEDVRSAISSHENHVIASPVHENKPCSMSSRCSSSTCMGAFPHEDTSVFPMPKTDSQVLDVKLTRSGSDLPPPIGPPRWVS